MTTIECSEDTKQAVRKAVNSLFYIYKRNPKYGGLGQHCQDMIDVLFHYFPDDIPCHSSFRKHVLSGPIFDPAQKENTTS